MVKRKRTRCYCGGGSYETCCAPLHRGTRAESAEDLTRSRYSAFVLGDGDYLWTTLHRDNPAKQDGKAVYEESLRTRPDYRELRIVESTEADDEGIARVLFMLRYRERGKMRLGAELSFFAKEDDAWRYVDGIHTNAKHATSIAAVEHEASTTRS